MGMDWRRAKPWRGESDERTPIPRGHTSRRVPRQTAGEWDALAKHRRDALMAEALPRALSRLTGPVDTLGMAVRLGDVVRINSGPGRYNVGTPEAKAFLLGVAPIVPNAERDTANGYKNHLNVLSVPWRWVPSPEPLLERLNHAKAVGAARRLLENEGLQVIDPMGDTP